MRIMLGYVYCPGTMSKVMMIWKWPLSQIIFNDYSLQKHLMTHNKSHVLDVDELGTMGMKYIYILFIRGNKAHVILKVFFLRLTRFCLKSLCKMWVDWHVVGWIIANISFMKRHCSWGMSFGAYHLRTQEPMD